VIINTYQPEVLHEAFGIDMSSVDAIAEAWKGLGVAWGRVVPGGRSDPHQHDETETFVIVQGNGELVVDGRRYPVCPGVVAQFEPFETHVIDNTGRRDLLFLTLYWRDAPRASRASVSGHDRLADRPVFVFSTPPTPNGDLHLGHLSGPYLGADVYVRFQRLNGKRAWHLTGSDDYQSYVVECARREGRDPAETAAHYAAEIAETLRLMDIPLDQYTVTNDDPSYRPGLQNFFSRLARTGRVSAQEGPALFDAATGDYIYEVDVTGGCPTCGAATGGNICEECGEPNVCVDLRDPVRRGSDLPPREGRASRYTLALHEFRSDVEAHHRLGRVPARLRRLAGQIFRRQRFDLPISHPSSWGVPPAEHHVSGQVIWVWPEMSYGFLHGIQALGSRLGEDWRADQPRLDWKIVHFFGYDNSFYHAILYPVLYRLAFPQWNPDIDYHVNEFLLLDGAKFSTSRRHAIWGKEILNPQSVDAVRYYLSTIRSEGSRTNFSRADFEAELRDTLIGQWQHWLNDLGRRVSEWYGGRAPDAGVWTPEHTAFLARLENRLSALTTALGADGFSLRRAAAELCGIVDDARRFGEHEHQVNDMDVWSDETRTATALELAAAKLLAHGATPVMPRFSAALSEALSDTVERWPQSVTLLPPSSRVDLAGANFFRAPAATATAPLLEWLEEAVRSTLQLPTDQQIAGATPLQLGAASLHAVTLQYLIMEETGADIAVDDLLGQLTVADLATRLLAEKVRQVAAP
jgi:methionyl-tRNA synthetase